MEGEGEWGEGGDGNGCCTVVSQIKIFLPCGKLDKYGHERRRVTSSSPENEAFMEVFSPSPSNSDQKMGHGSSQQTGPGPGPTLLLDPSSPPSRLLSL